MAKVKKLKTVQKKDVLQGVVDDGTREIPIVNKFGKLICNVYIRPSDLSIIDRYQNLVTDFDDIVKPLESLDIKNDGTAFVDSDWQILKSVENNLKQRINELFDMEEADEIFAKLGVSEIPAKGEKFDPELHNAVMHEENEDFDENTVSDVFLKGYKLGDKVIRHSVVKVMN